MEEECIHKFIRLGTMMIYRSEKHFIGLNDEEKNILLKDVINHLLEQFQV